MKPDIHPDYRTVIFHDTAADVYFKVGSTIRTERTIEFEGQIYPYITPRMFRPTPTRSIPASRKHTRRKGMWPVLPSASGVLYIKRRGKTDAGIKFTEKCETAPSGL